MIEFFKSPEDAQEEERRLQIELAAVNAAVANFYESLNTEQLRAIMLIYKAMINHPGSPYEHPVATYHLGQVTALLRYKFGMCNCGEAHKVEDHARVAEEREHKSVNSGDHSTEDNSHLLEEYRIEYIDDGPQVKCKGVYRIANVYGPVNCNNTWKSIDERMLQGKCGTCGYGPITG